MMGVVIVKGSQCCTVITWPEWASLRALAVHSTASSLGFANTNTNPLTGLVEAQENWGYCWFSLLSSASPGYYLGAGVTKICPNFPCLWGYLLHPFFPVTGDVFCHPTLTLSAKEVSIWGFLVGQLTFTGVLRVKFVRGRFYCSWFVPGLNHNST